MSKSLADRVDMAMLASAVRGYEKDEALLAEIAAMEREQMPTSPWTEGDAPDAIRAKERERIAAWLEAQRGREVSCPRLAQEIRNGEHNEVVG